MKNITPAKTIQKQFHQERLTVEQAQDEVDHHKPPGGAGQAQTTIQKQNLYTNNLSRSWSEV
jgi:hypothetical protein